MGTQTSKISLVAVTLEQPQLNPTRKELVISLRKRSLRCVTLDAIATELGIGHNAVQEMIESLGYWKICARWVPCLLTKTIKFSEKPSVQKCFKDIETKETIFC